MFYDFKRPCFTLLLMQRKKSFLRPCSLSLLNLFIDITEKYFSHNIFWSWLPLPQLFQIFPTSPSTQIHTPSLSLSLENKLATKTNLTNKQTRVGQNKQTIKKKERAQETQREIWGYTHAHRNSIKTQKSEILLLK